VSDLGLPKGALIAAVLRGNDVLIPRGDTVIRSGDTLVIGAEPHKSSKPIRFKEITLGHNNEWNGYAIRDLDISRQSLIVMVKRKDRTMIPRSDLVLKEGDTVYIYSASESDDSDRRSMI
jgi:voltage-gated potassium channel